MKVELRKWNIEDSKRVVELYNRVDRRYMSNRISLPYEQSEALSWISKIRQIDGIEGVFRAIIVDGDIVGSISVERKPDIFSIDAEIGYMILPEYCNKGIATKAIAAVCGTAFFELPIRRISAVVLADNVASAKALLKNGFELEGTMRRAVMKDDRIYDIQLYGRMLMPCPI